MSLCTLYNACIYYMYGIAYAAGDPGYIARLEIYAAGNAVGVLIHL